jgi:hypothetical protein
MVQGADRTRRYVACPNNTNSPRCITWSITSMVPSGRTA